MDQDRKSAVSKLEILIKQNKGLDKDVKFNLKDLINALKDGVPKNMDMERALKALEKALKEKKPDVWKQINEIHNSLATDSTGNVETESSAAAPEQKARAHGDTEMGFMEASFRAIIEILETNRDTEPFPKPDEREKETVGECYKYALKVAGLCKERKGDLDHAYNIIGEIHNQVMEVVVQAQDGSDKPTTISFKKESEGTRSTVPKKTELEMKAESEKRVRAASPSLQKKTDTTSSIKKGNKEKVQTVPINTEPNRAKGIEMKRTAVSSALNKLKDTKGALERSSRIIQELYNQVMEVSDDREKTEPLMNTTPKKKTNDTVQKTPQEIEPDIGNELEMKAAAVFAAFKKMKDTKGDLERVSKIIEDLHNRVMEVNVDQSQEHQETQTARGFKKSGVDMGHTFPKSTVPDMKTKLEKRANDVSSPPTKTINMTNSYKKETQETNQAVSTEIEPDNVKKLKMKAAAVSEALKKIKDTKGDLEHVSKIIEDLHNQAKEINVDQAQEKQETLTTTGFKQGGVDMGTTVPKGTVPGMTQKQEKSAIDVSSPSKKTIDKTSGPRNGTQETEQTVTATTEPDIRKELEKKAADVSEALKKIKDTKRDLERMTKIIEDLHNQAKEINVDQGQEKQETMTTTGFKKGSVDMGATVPKRNVPGMTQKQEKSANDVSSPSKKTIDKTSGNRKATQETEQTVPATIEPDIRKELEKKAAEVSDALKKIKDTKREAEYAACLLEELSSFSHATNKDDNGNVLSRPQNVETSQDFKEKDAKNVDNPRQKPHQCVRDENLEKYYKHASHVLRDMKESERLRNDLEIEKRQIRDLKTRLKSIQDENTKLNKEADSLRSRLSEHAGALLYHENPAIADLSDQNRPTKLAEKYLELYDNQWTDAFSKLQTEYSSASDEKLTGHLYNILVDGYVFCKDARQAQIINLQEIMLYPTDDVSKNRRRPTEEVSKMFSNSLSDAAKLSSKVTSGNIAKAFVKNEETKQKHGQMIKLCNTYIHECLQLCWYMQVQTPPLCLDLNTAKGHAFEKNSYKEYTNRGKKIAFVVWPALFLHEKGPLLSKGVAQGDSTGKQAAED